MPPWDCGTYLPARNATENQERAMAISDMMKLLKSEDLTDDQRSALLKRIEERKRDRQAVMSSVDQDLEALGKPEENTEDKTEAKPEK
jgi:hypothetical protein